MPITSRFSCTGSAIVAVWKVTESEIKIVEITYAGTHVMSDKYCNGYFHRKFKKTLTLNVA